MTAESAGVETLEARDYWAEARRPLNSLIFLTPLLLVYECGIFWVGGPDPSAVRNGADYWMRGWLTQAGFSQSFVLPALVVAGLLIWHLTAKHPWQASADTFIGMFAESLLFAFLLIVIGQLQDLAFQQWPVVAALSESARSTASRAIAFIGAGIYEEFLFRLCLLPACYGFFRLMRLDRRGAALLAVLATSLGFSLAHYVGPAGDRLTLFNVTFRALAGMFFSALFVLRGFGITVGCHAAYDLLVGVVLGPES